MFVVTAAGAKGGSTRSTTCVNLAVEAGRARKRAALIDIDPQCTSMNWRDAREAEMPVVTSVTPSRLAKAVQAARDDRFDLCLIDTQPHSSDATIQAAELSDLLLIPVKPWVFDLRTLETTARIVRLTGKPAYVVISAAPFAPRQIAEAEEAIRSHGLKVAPVVIHQRAAIAHATTMGLGVSEWDPNSKGAQEMSALWEWLASIMPKGRAVDHANKRSIERKIRRSSNQAISIPAGADR